MYGTVPLIVPGFVRCAPSSSTVLTPAVVSPRSAATFAMPQSMTWTSPNSPSITLSGLRSRWSTPFSCAKWTVSQIRSITVASLCSVYSARVSFRPRKRSFSTSVSVRPRTTFIVK
ncbi:MAG: hypothetical protein HMLKMBBP_00504 [Planctomycetes bacterium]|nr:hypothetical protein [Planctomycetota bacterium]